MSIHTVVIEFFHPADEPVPGAEDGTLDRIGDRLRQVAREDAELPDGVTVLNPGDNAPPVEPPGPSVVEALPH